LADKSTRLILDALTRAAAEPDGLPLFARKSAPGLFPATASAKPIAQRCRDDGLIQEKEPGGKSCAITDKGLQWLMSRSSPRQVLEDFLRVLEQKQAQTADLITAAQQMAAGLESLKCAIERLTPKLNGHHLHPSPSSIAGERGCVSAPRTGPVGGVGSSSSTGPVLGALTQPRSPAIGNGHGPTPLPPQSQGIKGDELDPLDDKIVELLDQWRASSAGDCPLPELYRRLTARHAGISIGRFHDLLRHLHDTRRVYLHPWTGPLYELPEPPLALLVGHEVAYYASPRLHGGNS
jgi:hypothetical protein